MLISVHFNVWQKLRCILYFVNDKRRREALKKKSRVTYCEVPVFRVIETDIFPLFFGQVAKKCSFPDLAGACDQKDRICTADVADRIFDRS